MLMLSFHQPLVDPAPLLCPGHLALAHR